MLLGEPWTSTLIFCSRCACCCYCCCQINLAHLFSGGGAKWDVYKVTLEPSKSSDDGDDKDVGYSESDCNDDNSHDDHGGELTLRLLRTDGYSTASDAVWGCLYAFPLRVAGVAETVEKVKADLKTSQRRCRRKTTENEQLRKGLEASKATVSALKAEIDEHKAATISAQKKTTRARAELKRVKDAAAIATKAPADAAFRRAADGSTVSTTLPPKTPATTSTPTPSASSELESLRAKLQVHECAISELSGRMTRQKLKFYLMPQSYSSTKQQGKKSTKRQATQQSQQNSAQPVHTNHDQQQQHRTEPPHQPKRQKIDDDDVKPEWVDV